MPVPELVMVIVWLAGLPLHGPPGMLASILVGETEMVGVAKAHELVASNNGNRSHGMRLLLLNLSLLGRI